MSLKELRQRAGLTQQDAAKLFGLKHRTYQNYELGITSPNMDTAAEFARYFHCTIGDLFDLEEGASDHISDAEHELINLYKSMNPDGKKALIVIARSLSENFNA